MKTLPARVPRQPIHHAALAAHIAGADPTRELVTAPRHRWRRIALVGAIPVIGILAALAEAIRWGLQ